MEDTVVVSTDLGEDAVPMLGGHVGVTTVQNNGHVLAHLLEGIEDSLGDVVLHALVLDVLL